MIHRIKTIVIAFMLSGCATTPKVLDSASTKIDPADSSEFKLEVIDASYQSGVADYQFLNKPNRATWHHCASLKNNRTVVFFHGRNGINERDFCKDWTVQLLLKNGFNVTAVSRPSYNMSTGTDDVSGPQSIAAIIAGVKASPQSNSIEGFWGIDTGTIAAAFTAKEFQNLNWLLLGSGFYDLEVVERNTKDMHFKETLQKIRASEGDSAFEKRSVGWDSSKLPKKIGLYHSKNDDTAPINQADAFNSQLRTAQSKVFFDSVDGGNHDIPWQGQYQIVQALLTNLKSL
jgi:hypothetical protein